MTDSTIQFDGAPKVDVPVDAKGEPQIVPAEVLSPVAAPPAPQVDRPSYLDYNSRPHSRSVGRFLGIVLLIFGVLVGFYFLLNALKNSSSINQIEVGAEPLPSAFDTSACPPEKYLDCMGDKADNPECASTYVKWAKDNCIGFVGAAYRSN